MTPDQEVIWLAGLLEGEGNFAAWKDPRPERGRSRPSLRVQLRMSDADVVQRAATVFPGGERIAKYIDPRPRTAPMYRKCWNGANAEAVMRAVLPYMGERRAAKIRECLATPNLSHTPRKAVTA